MFSYSIMGTYYYPYFVREIRVSRLGRRPDKVGVTYSRKGLVMDGKTYNERMDRLAKSISAASRRLNDVMIMARIPEADMEKAAPELEKKIITAYQKLSATWDDAKNSQECNPAVLSFFAAALDIFALETECITVVVKHPRWETLDRQEWVFPAIYLVLADEFKAEIAELTKY